MACVHVAPAHWAASAPHVPSKYSWSLGEPHTHMVTATSVQIPSVTHWAGQKKTHHPGWVVLGVVDGEVLGVVLGVVDGEVVSMVT